MHVAPRGSPHGLAPFPEASPALPRRTGKSLKRLGIKVYLMKVDRQVK